MFFKPKKTPPSLRLYDQDSLVYDGLLKDIPLKESIILEKSVQFFDDPEPCHIHRNAVRVRLTEEILRELMQNPEKNVCSSLTAYADLSSFDRIELILPDNFKL